MDVSAIERALRTFSIPRPSAADGDSGRLDLGDLDQVVRPDLAARVPRMLEPERGQQGTARERGGHDRPHDHGSVRGDEQSHRQDRAGRLRRDREERDLDVREALAARRWDV